jgi:hypothetical protein
VPPLLIGREQESGSERENARKREGESERARGLRAWMETRRPLVLLTAYAQAAGYAHDGTR